MWGRYIHPYTSCMHNIFQKHPYTDSSRNTSSACFFNSMLYDYIAAVLPENTKSRVLHVQSQAYQCKNLRVYSRLDANKPAATLKVKHYLVVVDAGSEMPILGIEVYVYLGIFSQRVDHHIFVAKADTTGLDTQKRYRANDIIGAFLRYLIEVDKLAYFHSVRLRSISKEASVNVVEKSDNPTLNALHSIIRALRSNSRYYRTIPHYNKGTAQLEETGSVSLPFPVPSTICTKISLFTRAANEYLFPNSNNNASKHVVDGNRLFSWWIKLISKAISESEGDSKWTCKALLPGGDSRATEKFLVHDNLRAKWSIGSIFNDNMEELAIHRIPLFPDDPKGRFLEHLIAENRYKSLRLSQFWEELGFRQEFRLGDVVGIIGCETDSETFSLSSSPVKVDTSVLPVRVYKSLMKVMKNESFDVAQDARDLIVKKLPEFMKANGVEGFLVEVCGRKSEPGAISKDSKRSPTTNLSSLVRKKPKTESGNVAKSASETPVNNLNGLVKRRKKV